MPNRPQGIQKWSTNGPQGIAEAVKTLEGAVQAFTGADIRAVIIRRDDDRLFQIAQAALQQELDKLENTSESTLPGVLDGSLPVKNEKIIYPVIELSSITVSTFRNKLQVRSLGQVNARGIARGSRTIAGTMIMTEFERDVLWELIRTPDNPVPGGDQNVGDSGSAVLADQLTSFDVLLLFTNEFGARGYRLIYGIELVTIGSVYSAMDMYNEVTMSFLAGDVTPLIPLPVDYVNAWSVGTHPLNLTTTDKVTVPTTQVVNSGKEILRRFRLLKAASDPFR